MNRQQRRAVAREANKATKRTFRHAVKPGEPGVTLSGGPMDTYIVPPDAPVLRGDWWQTWPWSVREKWRPGAYYNTGLDESGVEHAEWREF